MLTTALVAFGLTLVISPAVLVGLHRLGVMDIASGRSSHVHATPRGGGIAIAIGASTALLTTSSGPGFPRVGILVAAAGFGFVGLLDDILEVPALWRLAWQVATAACAVIWLVPLSGTPTILQVLVISVTILWAVGFVNAFNFMDGINGISVVQALVAGTTWLAIAELWDFRMPATTGVIVAAAALGFAPFNFPRARMFLGDVGSYFIGGWLAAVAVLGVRAGVPAEAVLAPLALYVADTGTTLAQRVRRGQTWHAAHRDHTYQRLVDRGWSHQATTLVVGLLLVVVSALGLLSLTDSVPLRVAGDVAAVVVLLTYLRAPDLLAGRDPALKPAHS